MPLLLGMLCFRDVIYLPRGTCPQTEGLPCTTDVQKSQTRWLSYMLLHGSIYGEEQGPVSVPLQPWAGLLQRGEAMEQVLSTTAVISE